MKIPALRSVVACVACYLSAGALLQAADTDIDQTSRYVGTFELGGGGQKMHVYRDGAELKARPDGSRAGTLIPESQPARFSMIEAPFLFQFLEDEAGVVVALELTGPDGKKLRMRRLVDVHDAIAAAPLHALGGDTETSVKARIFNGYERKRDSNGNFLPETYAVGNGGFIDYYGAVDSSIEHKSFQDIVRTIAPALARQSYQPGNDPTTTHLLLMIYWGATGGEYSSAAKASPVFREMINRENARLLGYESALKAYSQRGTAMVLFSTPEEDLMNELEETRYWVALCAFDYQAVRNDKKLKLLWTVRYNIPSVGTNFDLALPQMTDTASRYFGQDSGGLVNRPSEDKTGRVELGEARILGVESPQ
jgi:hypothetical protein